MTREEGLKRRCPKCDAARGKPCTGVRGAERLAVHKARLQERRHAVARKRERHARAAAAAAGEPFFPAMAVACPRCGAAAGRMCRAMYDGNTPGVHRERIVAFTNGLKKLSGTGGAAGGPGSLPAPQRRGPVPAPCRKAGAPAAGSP